MWSSSRSARDNLQDILGISLPESQSFDQSEIKLECGICLSYDLDGDNPDQICTNDICARPFHRRCLIQWLTSKDDTRQSYNTYFGKCPYCKSSISVAAC
ncbi:hypothetical protein H4R99_008643 [Coemansia sp. RSA 1722]|nr:hypothetical protein H4R99_008643 [Coemansia sp. RSA 1722]